MKAGSGTKPLVSIIVRTQGRRRKLLALALNSLAAQTHDNLEVIVVEDGSDSVEDMIAVANGVRSGVFIHRPIERSGRCLAGNAGLAFATGAYLGFLDEDDELYPDHIETLMFAITHTPHFRLAYGRAHKVLCEGLAEDDVSLVSSAPDIGMLPFSRTSLWQQNRFPIQAALFARTLYETHGGLDPELELLEDWDLWLRYSASEDFLAVDAYTSLYRMPARKKDTKEREVSHEKWRPIVIAKHHDLYGLHRFEDIVALPQQVVRQLSFRAAAAAAMTAMFDRIKNFWKQNA